MADYFRALCARMADELDHCRQLLTDNRRETHALATEARAALAQPEPAPTDEPLGDLINAWVQEAFKKKPYGCSHPTHAYVACKAFEYGKNHASARPHPISVSERMPEPEDCDSEGKCWVECPAFVDDGDHGSIAYNPSWKLCRCTPSVVYDDTRWLPANALPTPEAP